MKRIVAVLLAVTCACALPGRNPGTAGAEAERAKPAERAPGRLEFDQAHDAIDAGNLPRAIELLTAATQKDAEVCEYWFDLGAAESNRAIDVSYESDAEAVRLFEQAVDHKKEALRLIKADKCSIWDANTLAAIQREGEVEIPNAEEMLRDKTNLVMMLRMFADQRRR